MLRSDLTYSVWFKYGGILITCMLGFLVGLIEVHPAYQFAIDKELVSASHPWPWLLAERPVVDIVQSGIVGIFTVVGLQSFDRGLAAEGVFWFCTWLPIPVALAKLAIMGVFSAGVSWLAWTIYPLIAAGMFVLVASIVLFGRKFTRAHVLVLLLVIFIANVLASDVIAFSLSQLKGVL